MARKKIAVTRDLGIRTPWPEIRSLVELGVPMVAVAKAYHLDVSALSKRKKLEGWSTPKEVSERAKQLLAEQIGDPNDANPLLTLRARQLLDNHLGLRETVHQTAIEAAKAFKDTKRTPATFFELESMMRVADKAAGMDRDSGNGGSGGNSQPSGPPIPSSRFAINVAILNPNAIQLQPPQAHAEVEVFPDDSPQ